MDKEFGFISEAIGSRLVLVTTSDVPEVELEVSKGKGKDKSKEVINLEELIDIKGWKALGNRLTQHKVIKVSLVDELEDTGIEDGDDDNEELIETTETKAQSSKKKEEAGPAEEVGEDGQVGLFAEQKKDPKKAPSHQQKAPEKKPKVKTEQANLFGEQSAPEKSEQPKKESSKKEKVAKRSPGEPPERPVNGNTNDKTFGIGESLEWNF
jgi:topoisomerase-4 subunit A